MTTTPTTVAAPTTVTTAYWLDVASVVLNVIGLVVTFITLPAILAAAQRQALAGLQGQDIRGVDVAGITNGVLVFSLVFGTVIGVAFIVLTFVFAGRMRRGRNWARIVLAVFAGLHLFGLFALISPNAANQPASVVLTVVIALATIVAAILSFLPASNQWFAQIRAARVGTAY